jgi:hypothetical protein
LIGSNDRSALRFVEQNSLLAGQREPFVIILLSSRIRKMLERLSPEHRSTAIPHVVGVVGRSPTCG